MKFILRLLTVLIVLSVSGVANSRVTRNVDSFDGSIVIKSSVSDWTFADGFRQPGYGRSDYFGTFDTIQFYKKRTPSGRVFYMLYATIVFSSNNYFGYDSIALANIDGRQIFLQRLDYSTHPQIDSIYIYGDELLSTIGSGPPYPKIQIRVTGTRGTRTAEVPSAILHEWTQVIAQPFDDPTLSAVTPIGGEVFVVGTFATGWAVDPKVDRSKCNPTLKDTSGCTQVHVYRGSQPLFAISADVPDCDSSSFACSALPLSVLAAWRRDIYQFDLNRIKGVSIDPVRVIAINSNEVLANVELASTKLALTDDIECVFNWAEKILPRSILPETGKTTTESVNRVRRYSNGAMLVAIFGSGVLSGALPGKPLEALGNVIVFLPAAVQAGCGR